MLGMDISLFQKGIDLSAAEYDFCIIKATEGRTYISSTFNDYRVQLTELGKLIGCYHYARPDLNHSMKDIEDEAEFFLSVMDKSSLLSKAILILDWEEEPYNNEEILSAWINYVKKHSKATPFIYGGMPKLNKWKRWQVFKDSPIWLAGYPTTKPFHIGINPKDEHSEIKVPDEIDWKIWQYTSNGKYPNFNISVDLDWARMTKEEWKLMAGDVSEEINDEVLTEDMKWAISVGLFSGYPDGQYRPTEPLTREQAATLFHKYSEILKVDLNSSYPNEIKTLYGRAGGPIINKEYRDIADKNNNKEEK